MFSIGLAGKIALGSGVIILAMSGAFYLYFNYSQEKIQEQASKVATLESANSSLVESINRREAELARQAKALTDLNNRLITIRRESTEMAELLARHDLKYLAANKPGLIENRVNRGTQDVFDQLKDLSRPEGYGETRAPTERKE